MTNNTQANQYILATQNDYDNPVVISFTTAKERADYLKNTYRLHSVNTKFYMYDSIEEFFESTYYEQQVQELTYSVDESKMMMFKEDLLAVLDESGFDASMYQVDDVLKFNL